MKLAIVTGASRGLGLAIARELIARGWAVAGMARGEMATATGFIPCRVDLADTTAALAALHDICSLHAAGADELCLINNAGVVAPVAPVGQFDAATVAAAVALNLTTAIALTSEFIKLTASMKVSRKIVNISSGAAHTAYAGWGVYCATKAGLDHFSRCVALEQESQTNPVRIAAIAPGVVDTDMQAQLRDATTDEFPARQRFVDLKSSGGLQAPNVVAAKLIDHLQSPVFGNAPVVDLRSL